jgi:hypothetical protein
MKKLTIIILLAYCFGMASLKDDVVKINKYQLLSIAVTLAESKAKLYLNSGEMLITKVIDHDKPYVLIVVKVRNTTTQAVVDALRDAILDGFKNSIIINELLPDHGVPFIIKFKS